ncbi:flagellar motor protein MotB [Inquilinus limosus]|uniref:flagellar motor protein MotB n=1 Tax=Inquilinus limosus TaxID=171674 RepID=UPI00041038FE|nr:flagellar motor protein MotB [Inquilinus limosus]
MATGPKARPPQIVIKRRRGRGHEDHGGHGAWKIAFADFMTAMMAFFLLMWLLNVTTEQQRDAIALYFNPMASRSSGAGGEGVLDGADGVFQSSQEGPESDVFSGQPQSGDQRRIGRDGEAGVETGTVLQADPAAMVPVGSKPGEGQGDLSPYRDAGPWLAAGSAEITPTVEGARFAAVQQRIQAEVAADLDLGALRDNVRIEMVPEGMRIELTDRSQAPMFEVGSGRISAQGLRLIRLVGQAIAGLPNPVAVSGHTDGRPYAGRSGYGNWELSADRANAARRGLVAAGVDEARFARVEGLADRVHLLPEDPADPRNRRISITILRAAKDSGKQSLSNRR